MIFLYITTLTMAIVYIIVNVRILFNMLDAQKLDVEKIKNPSPNFKLFAPKPDDERLKTLAEKLHDEKLYLSDEYRDYKIIYPMFQKYFSWQNGFNVFYEYGDFDVVMGFLNIIPEFRASLLFKMINKDSWGKGFVRESKRLIDVFMDAFKLKRLGTESPDEKVVRMAHMVGFQDEGIKIKDFKWDGQLFDVTMMSITREE